LQPSAARPVSRPHDADEREATRAADVVARGGSVASWSFSTVTASSVQRQEVLVEKTDEEKKKEALEKTKEAALETPQAKALKKKVLADPLVKTVKDAVTSTPGLIVSGAALAGGVGALAATGKELPIQPPEIPLDKITPGLSGKVTYQGPVNAPTFVGLSITYKEQGPKKKPGPSQIATDVARLKAQEQMFKPEGQKTAEKQAEQEMVSAWIASQSGLTIPLKGTPKAEEPPKKEEEAGKVPVQPAPASPSVDAAASANVDDALASPGRPLDARTERSMEARFGYDFSSVRVHDDARAAATAASIDAAAFTVGDDVVFGSARFDPSSAEGGRLLAHELAHVVQQGRAATGDGPVRRDTQPATQAAQPQMTPRSDQELRAYLETIRRTRAIVGSADAQRKALEVIARWRARAPDFAILTIPERVLLVRELLQGSRKAASEAAILDLFTEALPEERLSIMWDVGEDAIRTGLSPGNRRSFDDLVRTSVDRSVEALVTKWTVDEVVRILDRHGDVHVIDDLLARGYRILRFETAFDRWRYDDGHREEVELKGLRGNTDRDARIIRLRADLSSEEAAATLFHEIRHAMSASPRTDDERLEDEISARVRTEEFRIRHGMGPTRESYRRTDGTVDESAIRREIHASPHYNPRGRERIGRRYVGDARVTGWRPPPSAAGTGPAHGGGGRP
jgi:hypothetical protein